MSPGSDVLPGHVLLALLEYDDRYKVATEDASKCAALAVLKKTTEDSPVARAFDGTQFCRNLASDMQNKVVTNTTILLRSGTYNENLVVDGFDSNCGNTGSNDVNDPFSVVACRGVTIIGDNRRVAGYTWTKGGTEYQPITEIGSGFPKQR